MDELEQRIVALGAALERGEIDQAMKELQACDLTRVVQSENVTPRLRALIDRALAVAIRVRDLREAKLRELEAKEREAEEKERALLDSITDRLAKPAELPLVKQLFCELFDEVAPGEVAEESKRFLEEDLRRALADPNVRIYLAEKNGEPAGLIRVDLITTFPTFRLRADHRCGYIDQMFVRAPFRKCGLGTRLLKLCEDWLRAEGVLFCMLHAAPKAQAFYGERGYQTTRELFRRL